MIDENRLRLVRKWLDSKPSLAEYEPQPYRPHLVPLVGWKIPLVDVRRRMGLPHWTLEGSTYFITFRLLNRSLGNLLSAQNWTGARIFEEFLFYDYRVRYDIDAYVVMPDHIHLLIRPFSGHDLEDILKHLKGRSSRYINLALKRRGKMWKRDSFDSIIRGIDHWTDKFDYIHRNPVKAGLVATPQEYPWSSVRTMFSKGRLESFPWGYSGESPAKAGETT
ncbi:MAG: transposase [Planctomycetota bacterium]